MELCEATKTPKVETHPWQGPLLAVSKTLKGFTKDEAVRELLQVLMAIESNNDVTVV